MLLLLRLQRQRCWSPPSNNRAELEALIKARLKPGERALPELKSSPAVWTFNFGYIVCGQEHACTWRSCGKRAADIYGCMHLYACRRWRCAPSWSRRWEKGPGAVDASELQRLRAQLDEALRSEERLRQQLIEVHAHVLVPSSILLPP